MSRTEVGHAPYQRMLYQYSKLERDCHYIANVSWSNSLAYLEMRMILAKLFWKYDLCWMNTDDVDWERDTKGYTLWQKPELRCTFKARTA